MCGIVEWKNYCLIYLDLIGDIECVKKVIYGLTHVSMVGHCCKENIGGGGGVFVCKKLVNNVYLPYVDEECLLVFFLWFFGCCFFFGGGEGVGEIAFRISGRGIYTNIYGQ